MGCPELVLKIPIARASLRRPAIPQHRRARIGVRRREPALGYDRLQECERGVAVDAEGGRDLPRAEGAVGLQEQDTELSFALVEGTGAGGGRCQGWGRREHGSIRRRWPRRLGERWRWRGIGNRQDRRRRRGAAERRRPEPAERVAEDGTRAVVLTDGVGGPTAAVSPWVTRWTRQFQPVLVETAAPSLVAPWGVPRPPRAAEPGAPVPEEALARPGARAADIVGRLGYIKRRARVNGDRAPRWRHPDGIVGAVEQD